MISSHDNGFQFHGFLQHLKTEICRYEVAPLAYFERIGPFVYEISCHNEMICVFVVVTLFHQLTKLMVASMDVTHDNQSSVRANILRQQCTNL